MEYLKDYDFSLSYHPRKAIVVTDAMSRHTHVIASLMVWEWTMLEDLVGCRPKKQARGTVGAWVANLSIRTKLVEFIIACQQLDPFVQATSEKLEAGEEPHFSLGTYGELRFDLCLYVPQYEEARQRILDETHRSKYTIHLGSTKMYQDLNRNFWWPGMKRDVTDCRHPILTTGCWWIPLAACSDRGMANLNPHLNPDLNPLLNPNPNPDPPPT